MSHHSSVLSLPQGTRGYTVSCDASRVGLGCVVMQHGKVIAYASRQLKRHEQNLPCTHFEDGNNRVCLKDLEGLFVWWMELLKDYNCTILYHPGKANVVADALSRKSMGSLAHIFADRRFLIKEVHRLGDMGVHLEVSKANALLAHFRVRPILMDRIKEA
ncbi:Reverse transcriptase/retrotransposon-derived protein [Theobroma cacao]|nr:Reverse transcriptase/retrotransposon-derived protein [Theobroma cacao]